MVRKRESDSQSRLVNGYLPRDLKIVKITTLIALNSLIINLNRRLTELTVRNRNKKRRILK